MKKTKYPKYLRDLDTGIVTNITPLADFGNGEFIYEVIADLGNMNAQFITDVQYTIGSTINLVKETPEQITMKGQVEYNNLQPLLERFGYFQREGDGNTAGQEVYTIGNGPNQYVYKENLPIVIKGYISSILDAARYCINFQWDDGQVTLVDDGEVSEYAPKTMYDIGVLHTQFLVELNNGEALNLGKNQLDAYIRGRAKSIVTKQKQKEKVEDDIRATIEAHLKLQRLVTHNYIKTAALIEEVTTSKILPSVETVAEKYLPRMYPKKEKYGTKGEKS